MVTYITAHTVQAHSSVQWLIYVVRWASLFTGLEWTGLDWTGVDWTHPNICKMPFSV